MNILVTGANGYLGGVLCQGLSSVDPRVTLWDSHARPLREWDRFPVGRADVVVHLGWYSKVGDGEKALQFECLRRTGDLLYDMRKDARIVFASSASVYGDGGDYEFTEGDVPEPGCAYSKCKLAAEEMVRESKHPYCIFRFGSLMGLGFTRTKIELCVNAFATRGYGNGTIEVWNPQSWKPILHVIDAANLIRQATTEGKEWDGTFNAAEGSYRAIDIANIVARVTQSRVAIVESPNGARSSRLNCTALDRKIVESGMKWSPTWIEDTVREFRRYEPTSLDRNVPWSPSA